jgi:phosphoesterase RecJ-like protein
MNFNNTPIDWDAVHNVIKNATSIMLTTHENPDGDGLGAESGLYYHLKEQNKDVRIINYSPLPREYKYLNSDNIFECYDNESHDDWIKDIDLVIVFDVGDFLRIRTLVNTIEKYDIETMNIDHHPHPDDNVFTYNLVNLSAAATGCMVYDYLKVVRDKPIPKNSLLGIYTAMMTDTGCFRYSNTDNKCHEIAIECLNIGIETHKIYQHIYENSTRSRIKLMGEFLSNLKYELDGTFAWFIISNEMMKVANATRSDVDGFTDMVRTISGVEVSLMIFQQNDSSCRINFRSKGRYSVNDIAKELGGGGHAFAAGAVVNGSLKDVSSDVVKATSISIEKKMTDLL